MNMIPSQRKNVRYVRADRNAFMSGVLRSVTLLRLMTGRLDELAHQTPQEGRISHAFAPKNQQANRFIVHGHVGHSDKATAEQSFVHSLTCLDWRKPGRHILPVRSRRSSRLRI